MIMTYTAIVEVENNRIIKFAEFDNEQEALSHVDKHGGFVYSGGYSPDLFVDGTAVTVQPIEETPEQIIARLERAIDNHLDAVAQSYRYESIRTMVTYAASDHPKFGPEGRAAVKFRDAVYGYGYAKIEACTRQDDPDPIPTAVELIAALPVIEDFFE
jgi:hypothetical protein